MQKIGIEGLPLFARREPLGREAEAGIATAARGKGARIRTLVPLARELARKAGRHGVTVSDLRLYAVQRWLLPAESTGRELAWLGSVLPAAGLVATQEMRRSTIKASHANPHRVWVAKEFAE